MRRGYNRNFKNTIILIVCPSKILHKHCFHFLLGLTMVPRENKSNILCKILEGQTMSIMVFLKVAYKAKENVFRVCMAWYKHGRGWENSRWCKPETKSRVCITVENSPNPSSFYIRLGKHRKNVFHWFYKITSYKTTTREKIKQIHFTSKRIFFLNHWFDNGISNWPIKTYILKIW